MRCDYDITLRSCRLTDPVNLVNARLQGLHLSDVTATGLSAENARLDGSLFLRDGTHFEGEVSLAGASISGDLQICGAELLSDGQDALFAPTLQVDGSVFLGNYPYGEGITTLVARRTVFLSSARVGHDMFISNTAISLNPERVTGGVFGATEEHGSDMALSLGRARIGGILSFQDNKIGQGVVNLAGATVGYGYRPGRSILMAIALMVGLGLFFEKTWEAGDMAPNAAPILTSGPWIAATQTHPDNPAAYWASVGQAGQDWETFNGFAYAADLVIPLVSLGQEGAWAPSTSRSDWGRAGWWIRWFAKGIGWVIAALVASAVTGVIRQD